mmetsp:Transcript_12152/g.30456  ORF Transcript_12152/g.30456 Transcript_12152/m.30456 type:complete len:389 (-) Transcript_12152:889-2055(-)
MRVLCLKVQLGLPMMRTPHPRASLNMFHSPSKVLSSSTSRLQTLLPLTMLRLSTADDVPCRVTPELLDPDTWHRVMSQEAWSLSSTLPARFPVMVLSSIVILECPWSVMPHFCTAFWSPAEMVQLWALRTELSQTQIPDCSLRSIRESWISRRDEPCISTPYPSVPAMTLLWLSTRVFSFMPTPTKPFPMNSLPMKEGELSPATTAPPPLLLAIMLHMNMGLALSITPAPARHDPERSLSTKKPRALSCTTMPPPSPSRIVLDATMGSAWSDTCMAARWFLRITLLVMTTVDAPCAQKPPCPPLETLLESKTPLHCPQQSTPHLLFLPIRLCAKLPSADSSSHTPKPVLRLMVQPPRLVYVLPQHTMAACTFSVRDELTIVGLASPIT